VITLNGEARERDGATIVELLAELGVEERARGCRRGRQRGGRPQGRMAVHRVDAGDRVEALSAMQGG
jgi:sulfur carrier protein ThiS